jgi:DNA-binding response OmpR family regulator
MEQTEVDERDARGGRSRVLLIDGEESVRTDVSQALTSEGLAVEVAGDGPEGLRRALAGHHDLIIFDLLVPGADGRSMLRELVRDQPGRSVLVLSRLADVQCKVDCFELGARDYLTKPFSLAELVARARNQLRGPYFDRTITVGSLTLHVGRMEADLGRGPTRLTRLEFLVLRELMEHAGQSVSKGQLLASVWGYESDPGSNIVGVCVRRLRSKFGEELIRTVKGEGYQLAAE